jgi:hypothetical protein
MSDPNFVILYVENAVSAASFYADLLGHPPVESSPTFAIRVGLGRHARTVDEKRSRTGRDNVRRW